MTVAASLVLAGMALAAVMTCAWSVQRSTGNSGWIDVFWTFGTGAVACFLALAPTHELAGPNARSWLVATFAGTWSLRLGGHIFMRTLKADDDPRYRDMIRQWGSKAPSRLFGHLQSQALVGLFLAICVMLAARNPAELLRPQDVAAFLVFLTGIAGEAIADAQLRGFKRSPANGGKVCDVGLWHWSRHPNYFFEWLCWLSYPLLAIDLGGNYPFGYGAVLAPLCIYWLLTRVSGIPPLEAHMLRTRGKSFETYQRRTSPFFPWPMGR